MQFVSTESIVNLPKIAANLPLRIDIVKELPVNIEEYHEVIFVVKQNNLNELKNKLNDVSNPRSQNYGNLSIYLFIYLANVSIYLFI
jgi:hypothetical protein